MENSFVRSIRKSSHREYPFQGQLKMATGDTSHEFGISVPPLVEYLRGILREYSDGQIIKEIVQNAEDAGADTVKFLYDVRQYGTDTLYKDSLAPHQGPALYSFNNAKFKEKDWDGIQKPARSNKKKDPLKVGRFGIGFNSVYHITDLPSLMSDRGLGYIDPLQEHFSEGRRLRTGFRFHLDTDREIFSLHEDQFEPYCNIFPQVEGGISTGQFSGTLFRFPLRSAPSDLSDKTYNDEDKIDDLLDAFRVEADVVMMFLRRLSKIEVLKRPPGQSEPSLVIRVERKLDENGSMNQSDFSSRLEAYCSEDTGNRESVEKTDSVTFTTESHSQDVPKAQQWIVSHLIAGDDMSQELSNLARQQSHLPWGAVAIPLGSSSSINEGCEEKNINIGRLFCFLPLPPGEESLTGLPVHVHGFFGVNSDRRGIKWPGPDQTDAPAKWNKLLVSEVIPVVYVNAVKHAISLHESQQSLTADCIYQAWPDHEAVHSNFRIVLEPFYNALFEEAVIHSEKKGWMKIEDIHFNELTVVEDMEKAILKCFDLRGLAYARVPKVCKQSIQKYYRHQTSTVSSATLCLCLREDPVIVEKLDADEKLLILEYVLRNDASQHLEGFCLLPLDDGSFECFSRSGKPVYIPTPDFCRELVPGGHKSFIRTKHPLNKLLCQMDGDYQLKSLTLDTVAQVLQSTENAWISDHGTWEHTCEGQSLDTWLKKVWSMLYRESSSELSRFEGICLVPWFDESGQCKKLLPLSPKSTVMQRGAFLIENNLEMLISEIGVTITNCPSYVRDHPSVMRDEYVKRPTPEGLVQCMLLLGDECLIHQFSSLPSIHRDTFVECLSQAKLSPDGRKLLRRLPLFKRVPGTGNGNKLVSAEQCTTYLDCSNDEIPHPLKLPVSLIDGKAKSRSLLQNLGIRPMSKYELIKAVLEEISKGKLYNLEEKQAVLQWMIEQWDVIRFHCQSSLDVLRRMKFIPTSKSLLSPEELLDPRDGLLSLLFASQGLFPVAPFDSHHSLTVLTDLGMRENSQITSDELMKAIALIDESQSIEKSHALLKLLKMHPRLLQSSVINCIKRRKCIPCKHTRPEYYPLGIKWFGDSSSLLVMPQEILAETKQLALRCGASRCFVSQNDERNFSEVFKKIGMTYPSPKLPVILSQLEHCVTYTNEVKDQDVTDIIPMVKEIYSYLREEWLIKRDVKNVILKQVANCIWNGSGFTEPSKMCISKLPFALAPYMSSIPRDTLQYEDMFESLGVKKNMERNLEALVEILHQVQLKCDDRETDQHFKRCQRQLVLQILQHLQVCCRGELPQNVHERLLVPCHHEDCRLIPVSESAYIDREWMKQSTDDGELDSGEDFTLIHPDISMELAQFLQVRPVSRLLLNSEEFDGFLQAGQSESLTTRLHNILENNYSNTSITKEMIQNAEDAGAKEVCFLIDMRTNRNSCKRLFDPGMKSCQGPALWVYNDAEFTDEDFANILRLGGRTKEKDVEKIGKFGTGFNSVYHLTDVPSFVSRNYMQFFDPHATHLGNVLPKNSQPGVRLKLNSTRQLRRFPDQFKPFDGVFGLRFSTGDEPFYYHGTLFRLPLRSKEAAQKSKICKVSYDEKELISLMKEMWESSQNLLVFTKKVKKITLFYLSENSSHPSSPEKLFIIQKDSDSSIPEDGNTVLLTESFQEILTPKGVEVLTPNHGSGSKQTMGTFKTMRAVCKTSQQAAALAQSEEGKMRGLSTAGSVALPLRVKNLPPVKKEIYCGLSLSICSHLPVHIDGCFAVNENRRSLQSPTLSGSTISERWNHILLSDVICQAYFSLLSNIDFVKEIRVIQGGISPEEFWPDVDEVPESSECFTLFNAFYEGAVCGLHGKKPAIFWKDDKPWQFDNVMFVSQDVQNKEIAYNCVEALERHVKKEFGSSYEVIQLSDRTWRAFERAGVRAKMLSRTYDLNRLFDDVILPHLDQLSDEARNRFVLFALSSTERNLERKLKDIRCIPVFGKAELKKPSALMHKGDPILGELFASQGVFPTAPFDAAGLVPAFKRLGMRGQSEVTADEVVTCLNEIDELQDIEKARTLLQFLGKNPDHFQRTHCGKTLANIMRSKRCIPCRQTRPEYYPQGIEWHARSCSRLSTPQEIMMEKKENVLAAGASKCFVSHQDDLFSTALTQLKVAQHTPVLTDVIAQLEHCVKYANDRLEKDVWEIIPMVKEIYSFMKSRILDSPNVSSLTLKRVSVCIWNGSGFSEPSKMCIAKLPFALAPYMACIPPETCMYGDLFEALGVAKNLEANADVLVDILYEIKERSNSQETNASFRHEQRQLVLQILRYLRESGDMPPGARGRLLVPSNMNECHLIPVDQSAYLDRDWLKQGTDDEGICDGEDFMLIHSDISLELARFLNVRPVSQLLLNSEEFDGFDQVGQTEALTTRLWNILKNNYRDTSIAHEMIQNAEDAGAHEVRFLIDLRPNEAACEKLFSPGMKSSQGPALWVYNDAVFTDEDFANILRLGGRTKEKDTEKIGKFGTGFNSVYHITDVPSFVSREYMQFFDPHTTHLGNVLPNKSQPGVRLKLNSNKQLKRFPDQFKPFDGVFGLDFSNGIKSLCYSGTVFRLPLRTKEAAQMSDICKESYDGKKLIYLMEQIWESAPNLLMFTNNVVKVSVFYLGEHSIKAEDAGELFTIEKTVDSSPRMKEDGNVMSTQSMNCKMTPLGKEVLSQECVSLSEIHLLCRKVSCPTSRRAASLAQSPEGKECGLSPTGSVAFPFYVPPISSEKNKLFCFLPLEIPSNLPVHINGYFAVKEDRRSLHVPNPSSRLISEKWNHLLLEDVICRAYIALVAEEEFLHEVQEKYGIQKTSESLWPDINEVPKNSECSALFDSFYKAMVHGIDGHEPALFWKEGNLHTFSDVVFLGEEVQKEETVMDAVTNVLGDHLTSEVISMSEKTWRAFERVGVKSEVLARTYDFNRFFDEVFLPNISQVPTDVRNQLVLFALNQNGHNLRGKLNGVECIPTVGGIRLKKPCDLIHPDGEAAPLYSEFDAVFPSEEFSSSDSLASLCDLGMMKDSIHEDIFVERCETVLTLHSSNPETSQKRCYAAVKYLSKRLSREWSGKYNLKEKLMKVAFLPILSVSHRDISLPWVKIDSSPAYSSASELYAHSRKYLVSSTSNVVDKSREWELPQNVEQFLGLASKDPSIDKVLEQFSNFRNHLKSFNDTISNHQLETICEKIYCFLDIACKGTCPLIIQAELENEPFFLVNRVFVSRTVIAERGPDLPPYLFEASTFQKQFSYLMKQASLKSTFGAEDYQQILQTIHRKSNGRSMSNKDLEIVVLAAKRLAEFIKDENQQQESYLPDEQSCMRPVSELCYCDVDWFDYNEVQLHRCHQNISFTLAKKLKVKDIRQQMLQSIDMDFPGEEFGQHEKLTTRIKRILESYPSDETILKELLQNADDAGATEIHFVYDPRSHGHKKILGDKMKSLQGAALCVFNNQSFSDEDIRGIQNLGEGSKGDQLGKIGRYGVGFNAVYQLTDCPSFISNGERICMFDPLLQYIPGASPRRPGRQIRVDDSVRSSYPDFFPCYLEDQLAEGQDNFTVFRFPLRTAESELSKNVWKPEKIKKLLQDFETAAFESLLFLKNITQITISEISSSGDIWCTRKVCSEMSKEDYEKKNSFLREVEGFARASQPDNCHSQPEPDGVVYQMTLKAGGRYENWVICQKVVSPDTALENSMQRHKLLPIGGVAACLSPGKTELKGKAFCFLPLPIETGLPVHVHGYFALDHESRRHLWEGSDTGRQTKWNYHITQQVIAPAYVELLLWIQEYCIRTNDLSGSISCKQKSRTLSILRVYHTFFPRVTDKGSYWCGLVDVVYEIIASKALMLFPCLYRKDEDREEFLLAWKTPMDSPDRENVGYFNSLANQMCDQSPVGFPTHKQVKEDRENLQKALIEVTFPLLESPKWMMDRLEGACKHLNRQAAQYKVLEVSPLNVISFLHADNPLQRQLPLELSKSRIHDEKSLKILIKYCKKSKDLLDGLHGLPLLYTQDGKLRTFSRHQPVFTSEFHDVFLSQSHQFIHASILRTFEHQTADVFRKLDISAVDVLLHMCTPCLECGKGELMPLPNTIQAKWFGRLWELLASFCTGKKTIHDVAIQVKDELGHWAILPVVELSIQHRSSSFSSKPISHVFPISLSSTIIRRIEPQTRYWSIYSALESLNVYEVANAILREDTHPLIEQLISHENSGMRVLDVLMYWVDKDINRFQNLSSKQHEDILKYVSQHNNGLLVYQDRIKRLPCFQSIDGSFVSIRGYGKVLVLPSDIPKKEQDVWVKASNAIFLQSNYYLKDLYKNLGLADTTEMEVYKVYILPSFDRLSEESRFEHLYRVKELLQQIRYDANCSREELRKDVIWKLGLNQLPFIVGTNGELKRAADFFDPKKEIFSAMLDKDQLIPDRVKKALGLDFLREIGMQVRVTQSLFLSFARQLHQSQKDTAMLKKKSEILLTELRGNCEFHKDHPFMRQVGEIEFLVSDKISKNLESIHPCCMNAGNPISYSQSISSQHIHLIWSIKSVLPAYANLGKCYLCKTKLNEVLGMSSTAELMQVIQHTQNVCNNVDQKLGKKIGHAEKLSAVLNEILAFLSSKCSGQCSLKKLCADCRTIQTELQNTPIVFLEHEDEHCLVKADQISRTVEGNLEPFLYQLEDKLVPFFKLFEILGGTQKPSLHQYANVLEGIHNRGPSAWGDPNVVIKINLATCGLYKELLKDDVCSEFSSRMSLFLPSSHNTLKRSDHLLMNDVEHYKDRLQISRQPLLKVFQGQERVVGDAIAKLPGHLAPRTVSKEVTEKLSNSCSDSQVCLMMGEEPCEFEKRLEIIKSGEFLRAVWCVMKHNNQVVTDGMKECFKKTISTLKLTCMHRLSSILEINGNDIEGSETEVLSFIGKNELFVLHSEGENITATLLSVSIHINQFLGNVFEDKTYLSLLLSQKSPATIPNALKMFNIAVEGVAENRSFTLPDPGSTIPEGMYHLIEQDPWISYNEDDFIAYAQSDDDGDYYVYAKVIRRMVSDSLNSVYLIDTGGPCNVEVSVLDMHKIHIPKATSGMELVPSEGTSSDDGNACSSRCHRSSLPTNMEAARKQITDELEEIWRLPDDQRRKAVKRLMLKWHPDKHPEGPTEFFDEAFKHLQSEIERLRKGRPTPSPCWEDIFRSANQRAKEDRRRYTHFGGFASDRGRSFSPGRSSSSSYWQSGSFHNFQDFFKYASSVPDLRNARRWLRQGQEDLRAAHHDLDTYDEPSLEWVAYKCHQSVEKVLKAAQLATKGRYDSTHSIYFLASEVKNQFQESAELVQSVSDLTCLVGDQRARYPDRCAFSEIPHDAFKDKAKACEMIKLAGSVTEVVQNFIKSK